MDRLNVLSIDWDYFIKATAGERSGLFPDGGNENFPMSLQNVIWSSHYMTDELEKIKTDTQAVRKLKKCLKNLFYVPFMVTDSHKYAYEFINSMAEEMSRDSVNIVNVDYHHDIYENGEAVDCGNWLRKLMKKYEDTDSEFTWIAREDSDESGYSFDDTVSGTGLRKIYDLDYIFEYDWDAVFICRSGMWSPPHLDRNFRDAFKWILDSNPIQYETSIFKNRFTDVRGIAESQRAILNSVNK